MKLKIIAKIIEGLLGVTMDDSKPRADMYLPERLLSMAIVFLVGGIALGVYFAISLSVWAIVGAVLAIVLGIAAVLCWKNQTIHIISDNQFTYTTMFGKTYTYAFTDIKGLRKNSDSMTLYVADQKVHIESMAILSDRLVDLINEALSSADKN